MALWRGEAGSAHAQRDKLARVSRREHAVFIEEMGVRSGQNGGNIIPHAENQGDASHPSKKTWNMD
jgi:hypothetical protein